MCTNVDSTHFIVVYSCKITLLGGLFLSGHVSSTGHCQRNIQENKQVGEVQGGGGEGGERGGRGGGEGGGGGEGKGYLSMD